MSIHACSYDQGSFWSHMLQGLPPPLPHYLLEEKLSPISLGPPPAQQTCKFQGDLYAGDALLLPLPTNPMS